MQIQTAIAIMKADFGNAMSQAVRGVELAERSGAANVRATSHANLAKVLFLTGDYRNAVEHQYRAIQELPVRSDSRIAALDGLVRIRLAQLRLSDCEKLLEEINFLLEPSKNPSRYVHRHAVLTRATVHARAGRVNDALEELNAAIKLAQSSGDSLLLHEATLTKAELLVQESRLAEAVSTTHSVSSTVTGQPPNIFALYQRVLGCLTTQSDNAAAAEYFGRARRIYECLGQAPALVELELLYGTIIQEERSPTKTTHVPAVVSAVIDGISTAIVHAGRPEFVAREFIELLNAANVITKAKVVVQRTNGIEKVLSTFADKSREMLEGSDHRINIGTTSAGAIDVVATLRAGVESRATFDSLTHIVQSIRNLECARIEKESHVTLWPIEELPDDQRSVISGEMRKLMDQARRIARAKVSVLITGESGTGKEILARAIHEFSDRAQRPFVPFNCTAIPRDLLESQLFGHRRGAFTGADRDQLGLIRAAREGTLFLDEVGELSLDLQPKLLRFLESGEIAPLGEPSSLTVDVRIVAATNTHLEEAVRDGRFREDLFYRLNVVRLTIPPLRERRAEIPAFVNHFVVRAAQEFNKGQLRVADETMERLLLYRWPGNVRQLQNEVRRMVALAEPGSTLLPDAISEDILGALPIFRHATNNGREIAVDLHDKLDSTLARIECEMIKAALRTHQGKVDHAAKALGISRKGLYLKRRRLGL
jgi:transcriptional regulator with PAS, ATPase and Fis domain